ncbi:MAG: hypothetical protein Q9196_003664 [Gyalolechia fulgens]
MADKPSFDSKDVAKDALPAPRPKPTGNPVFRMMGLPNFRFKLPSRNWLIFLSITGSFTTAILYDRYHKRKAQQRWCNIVSHLAREPMASTQLPRKITIFLSAPPGDGLRAARDHFHEYVKPVLVAGALDWDVIEGRREGDVRAGLAERIRKRRRKDGEKPANIVEGAEEEKDLLQQLRDAAGIRDSGDVQGDLVLGRHTWKEYIRGSHEGWLGPLESPPDPPREPLPATDDALPPHEQAAVNSASPTPYFQEAESQPPKSAEEPQKPETPKEKEKSKEPTQQRPYIFPAAYPVASPAPSVPESLPPSAILPFPHLLGFLNTPVRIYRFLNRRHLADETGRQVAALVLANCIGNWNVEAELARIADLNASPTNTDTNQPDPNDVDMVPVRRRWEQESVLEDEERDWHKSAWQPHGDEGERVWKDVMVVDPRIGERMRRFQLAADVEEKARKDDGVDPARKGMWENLREMVGWQKDTSVKGWEHGFVGEEGE